MLLNTVTETSAVMISAKKSIQNIFFDQILKGEKNSALTHIYYDTLKNNYNSITRKCVDNFEMKSRTTNFHFDLNSGFLKNYFGYFFRELCHIFFTGIANIHD